MQRQLREGNFDPFGIESQLYLFVKVKPHAPVVSRFDPGAHHDIDRRLA